MTETTTTQVENQVAKAVRRTELLWNAWTSANAADRVEIKDQIDAIDREIRNLLGI